MILEIQMILQINGSCTDKYIFTLIGIILFFFSIGIKI